MSHLKGLLYRANEWFKLRHEIVGILKRIGEREAMLKDLKEEITMMPIDDQILDKTGAKMNELSVMIVGLKMITEEVWLKIRNFLLAFCKYFGKKFIYEGTDYV